MLKGDDVREFLEISDAQGILSYSKFLDYLDAGGESMQELNRAARTRQGRRFLKAYFESMRRIVRRERSAKK